MAIDIRAVVTCSLGTLISASISDDYIQGTGLVKYKGSCEIADVITPAIGTVVTFSYTKDGVTRLVPRKLRVLSSFADPFRRTTSVELGCKLTYLSDLRVPETLGALCDPQNGSYNREDAAIISIPIYATSVMTQCLTALELTASSYPLTNKFSIARFDFSPGYVQILSDLLVSESYIGYLDQDEVLQITSLSEEGGTGSVIDSSDIIDLGPIGVGQLPAESVLVNYSTLRLKQPDASGVSENSPWDAVVSSNSYALPISYTAASGNQETAIFNILESTITYNSYSYVTTDTCETQRVLTQRLTIENNHVASVIGGLVSEYLSNGIQFNDDKIRKITNESFVYDSSGNEIFYSREVWGPSPYLHGTAGVPWVFSSTDYVTLSYGTDFQIEREVRTTNIGGNAQQVTTSLYGHWGKSISGQQSIASGRESFTTASQVSDYLNSAFGGNLQLIDHRVTTEQRVAPVLVPSTTDVINAKYAKGGDANNGYLTESTAELELAFGSNTAKRRLELSMPYAPDDAFAKSGNIYSSEPSDAKAKANLYGRVQNKLLMGNRNGMNLQLAPESLPAAPFAPFIVQANGLSALYRTNGTSWTMDANGIVVSTDALFWGAVGGTGTFWFPVAPGITELPATPAVVDGQMTVESVVPVWNETVLADAGVQLGLEVSSLAYPLSLLTTVAPFSARTGIEVTTFRCVRPPCVQFLQQRPAPAVIGGVAVTPSSVNFLVELPLPFVVSGTRISPPSSEVIVSALDPQNAGSTIVLASIPELNLVLSSAQADLVSGSSVVVSSTIVTMNSLAPSFPALPSLTVATGTAAPVLGTSGAVNYDGWSLIQNESVDTGFINSGNFGFNFILAGTTYTSCFISSNGYLTFGQGFTQSTGFSATSPNVPKLLFCPSNNSYQRIFTKAGAAAGVSYFTIRYEGTADLTGIIGSPDLVYEITFYGVNSQNIQWVEVRVGPDGRLSKNFFIASASMIYAQSRSAPNTSWVYQGNSTGTSWSLTSNRYVQAT